MISRHTSPTHNKRVNDARYSRGLCALPHRVETVNIGRQLSRVARQPPHPLFLVGNGVGDRAEGDIVNPKVIAAAVGGRHMPGDQLPGHHSLGV